MIYCNSFLVLHHLYLNEGILTMCKGLLVVMNLQTPNLNQPQTSICPICLQSVQNAIPSIFRPSIRIRSNSTENHYQGKNSQQIAKDWLKFAMLVNQLSPAFLSTKTKSTVSFSSHCLLYSKSLVQFRFLLNKYFTGGQSCFFLSIKLGCLCSTMGQTFFSALCHNTRSSFLNRYLPDISIGSVPFLLLTIRPTLTELALLFINNYKVC